MAVGKPPKILVLVVKTGVTVAQGYSGTIAATTERAVESELEACGQDTIQVGEAPPKSVQTTDGEQDAQQRLVDGRREQ